MSSIEYRRVVVLTIRWTVCVLLIISGVTLIAVDGTDGRISEITIIGIMLIVVGLFGVALLAISSQIRSLCSSVYAEGATDGIRAGRVSSRLDGGVVAPLVPRPSGSGDRR